MNNFSPRDRPGLAFPGHLRDPLAAWFFERATGYITARRSRSRPYDLIRNGVRNEINSSDGVVPVLTLRDGFPQTASTGFPELLRAGHACAHTVRAAVDGRRSTPTPRQRCP